MSYAERGGSMGFIDNILSRFQKTDVLDGLQENPSEYHEDRREELARQALVREEQGRRDIDRKVRTAYRRQALEDVWNTLPRLGNRNAKIQAGLTGAVAFSGSANLLSPKQAIVSQASSEQQAQFMGKSDQFVTVDPKQPDLRAEIGRNIEAPAESVLPTADFIQVSDQASQKEILDLMQSGNLTKEKFLAFLDKNHLNGNLAKTLATYESLIQKNPNLAITFNVSKANTGNTLNIALCMRDAKSGKIFLANPLKPGEVMGLDSDGTLQSIQVIGDQAYLASFVPGPTGDEILYPYQTVILSNEGIPAPYSIGQGETTGNAGLIVNDTELPLQDGVPVSILASTADGYFWVKVNGQLGYIAQDHVANATRLPINFLPMANPNVKNAPKVTPEPSKSQASVFASYDIAKIANIPEFASLPELSGAARVAIDKVTDPAVIKASKDKSSGIYAPRENGPDRYWKVDAEGRYLLWTPNMTWDGEHNSPWLAEADRLVLPNSNTTIIMELDPTATRESWYPTMHFTPDALGKIDNWVMKSVPKLEGKKIYIRWVDNMDMENYFRLKGKVPVKEWITHTGGDKAEAEYGIGADTQGNVVNVRLYVRGDRKSRPELPDLDREFYSRLMLNGMLFATTEAKDPVIDLVPSVYKSVVDVLPSSSLISGPEKAKYIIDW